MNKKEQTMIYKTLQRKLKIEQHELHLKRESLDSGAQFRLNTITLVRTLSNVSPHSNLLITVCVGYVVLCINPPLFPYKE